ncbi:MAG: hypothetical protein V4573_08075 [Pseudomonadota bacterium]
MCASQKKKTKPVQAGLQRTEHALRRLGFRQYMDNAAAFAEHRLYDVFMEDNRQRDAAHGEAVVVNAG